jgi:hypothetical protein
MSFPSTQRSKTPYLDRELRLPRPQRGLARLKWWQLGLFAACLLIEVFRVFFALWFVVIGIHELGHLVGGLIVGERFDHIRIGPLRIERPHKISLVWTREALFTGRTLTLPLSTRGIRWRLFLSTLCGPAANLVSALLTYKVLPHGDTTAIAIGQLFIAASVLAGTVNLIPMQRRGMMSDGMTLWVLLFSKAKRERLIAILQLVSDVKQGQTIESFEPYPIGKWSSANDGTMQHVFSNWVAYWQSKNDPSAGQYLEACLAASSNVDHNFRSALITQAAQFQAAQRKRADIARQWLDMLSSDKPEFERYWAEAVILQQEKQLDAAATKIDETINYVSSLPDSRGRTVRLEALEKFQINLKEQIAEKAGTS